MPPGELLQLSRGQSRPAEPKPESMKRSGENIGYEEEPQEPHWAAGPERQGQPVLPIVTSYSLLDPRVRAAKVQGRRTDTATRRAAARSDADVPAGRCAARHPMGRARVPRTRCVVVRTRW